MSTTNLFVELIVIGLGAALWLGLLVLAATNTDVRIVQQLASEPVIAAAALPVIYLLGIVTDRLADGLARVLRMERKRETQYEGKSAQYFHDRALVLAGSQAFAALYEYSRSRQRICRGWVLNSLGILIGFHTYLRALGVSAPRLTGSITVVLLALAIGCWLSWEAMSSTELRRIKEQAAVLRDRQQPDA